MLSKLASRSISLLSKLDNKANKFYDRKHDLYEATLLTRCYTQHALRPLFVLRFYGPVNPMGSCRARSVYLTTRLLGRLSPLSG